MIKRDIKLPPSSQYPVDVWRFVQKKLNKDLVGRDEAIFSTSNGYIGIRGNFEEGEPVQELGTFISGFHESWPITYGEEAFGFAKTGQTMLNVTDAHIIKLFVDDEPFSLRHADIQDFERALDFKQGLLSRSLIWDTAAGKKIKVESERIVSFPQRHLVAIKYTVTALNSDAYLAIDSRMVCQERTQGTGGDPRKAGKFGHQVYNAEIDHSIGYRMILGHSTNNSQLRIVCGMDHQLDTNNHSDFTLSHNKFDGKIIFTIDAKENEPVTLYKYISYHTSSPFSTTAELAERADRTLDRAMDKGFDFIANEQKEYMDIFWDRSDIKLAGNPQVNQNIRFNLFHLLQASARVQNSGIGAKGLTGSGYEGHAFWDIEIYMLPFLIYNNPRVAKNLLIYRYNMLDAARNRARELSHKGALFPWRTINGEEASAFFAAGTAQYHINADIAYAIKKYFEITNDEEFIHSYGAEILIETARLWAELGFYNGDGRFHIHGVTGPDEYNAIVNNNTFTNLMARENLMYAAKIIRKIKSRNPEVYKVLEHKTHLEKSEITEWDKAAKKMFVPYDEKLGINPQDDTFLHKEPWDIEKIPKEKFPLLLHYHPLTLYRYRVIKQADVVLALFLLGDEFSEEIKKRNFDYYDPLTTGDSSLSVSIQGIMAAEFDYLDLATKYFGYALLMDIADIGGNVEHGLHLASMGGIWMSVVYGVAGMRDYEGKLSFDPKLLKDSTGIHFNLSVGLNLLQLDIRNIGTTYTLKEGSSMTFRHRGQRVNIRNGKSVTLK
jgi:alpha,alpha-trehalose phosphorylase